MTAVDLDELYSVPPEEFVATRSKIVAALKADARRDDAAAVQRLRRPRLAEHALNRAARTHPMLVERWAAAVATMDTAQSLAIGGGGGGAADLREAAAELRAAHAAVLAAAVEALGASGAAQRDDIAETLRTLAHPDGAPLLRAGVVGSEQLGDLALFAGAPDPVVRRPTKPAITKPATKPAPPGPPATEPAMAPPAPKIDTKQRRALERADAAARKEVAAADAALVEARAAVQAAKEAVAAATTRAAAARQAARDAAAALAELVNNGVAHD